MKNTLFTILFILISNLGVSQNSCSDFRTGRFVIKEKGLPKSFIERNDNFQIESMGDIVVTLKIEWINDCSYTLSFIEGNAQYNASPLSSIPMRDYIVEIISVKENSYTQETRIIGDDSFSKRTEMYRFNE